MNFKTTLLTAALLTIAGIAHAAPVAKQGTWESTLEGRDLDGNFGNGPEAFYDKTLNITWMRSGSDKMMSWADANAWASKDQYGVSGWRSPKMTNKDATCPSSACGYNSDPGSSELGHLYYVTLGNKSRHKPGTDEPQEGFGLKNTGSFANLQNVGYWTGTVDSRKPDKNAWAFINFYGLQGASAQSGKLYAISVHDGVVGTAMPVPEPETYALMLAGLAAVGLVARRRKAA